MAIKSILNVTALAGVKFTSRIIGYTVFGLIFNLFLFLYFSNSSSRHSGLMGAVTLFAPIIYFFIGQKQGAAAAFHFIVEKHGEDLSRFVMGKLLDAYPNILDTAQAKSAVIQEKLGALITTLSEQSRINKAIFSGLMSKFDFVAVTARVMEKNATVANGSREETVNGIAAAIKAEFNMDDLKPDLRIPAMLVGGNFVLVFICAKFL
ncbi:MAG: hypothetical protein V4495_01940 [Pseudomonadota bacterium]